MVPGISLFLRHFPFRLLDIRGKSLIASSGKPRIRTGMFKSSVPTSAGDRYVMVGFSRGPITRTGIPSIEPPIPKMEPTSGIRLMILLPAAAR